MNLNNLELLGDKVLIQLSTEADFSTETGIVIPLFENTTTDGGRPATELSPRKYLSRGKIALMSASAAEKAPELSVGDEVFIASTAASANFQFLLNRTQLVENWTGLIAIPVSLIEAKIKTNEKE